MDKMKWIDAKEKPRQTGEDFEYLVWVHDDSVGVEYCWPNLCHYERGRWTYEDGSFGSKPTKKDIYVVKYCKVPDPIIWDA